MGFKTFTNLLILSDYMGKNSEYMKALYEFGDEFAAEHGIYLSEKFDPRRWLRSFRLDARIDSYMPRKVDNPAFPDAVFAISVKSQENECFYRTRIDMRKNDSEKIVPYKIVHTCADTLFSQLACKHTYRALAEVDNRMPSSHSSTFMPHSDLIESYENIESSRKDSINKLSETFDAMGENMRLNERKKLSILNARIDFMKI